MASDSNSPNTDRGGQTGWQIRGPVIRLRLWGRDRAYGLPELPIEVPLEPPLIGSAEGCEIHLEDSQVSRKHAALLPCGDGWKIRDLDSMNGLWLDGARRLEFQLHPGQEVGIGRLRLVAESSELIALNGLVARYLGWAAPRVTDVDDAVMSLRNWAAKQTVLVIRGDGDVDKMAERLHRMTLGPDAVFTRCENYPDGATALRAAPHGALAVWAHKLPPDFGEVVKELGDQPDLGTRLVVCARDAEDAAVAATHLKHISTVAVPSIASRADELERLALECADEQARDLGAPATSFKMDDLDLLSQLEYNGIPDLELNVRRLVAIRTWGITKAAEKLQIRHTSLLTWARRRKFWE